MPLPKLYNHHPEGLPVTGETVVVPQVAPYRALLDQAPKRSEPITALFGSQEFKQVPEGAPVLEGQFWVGKFGDVQFHPNDAGKSLSFTYTGIGSVVRVEHLNKLAAEIEAVDAKTTKETYSAEFWVSGNGSDEDGDGSRERPWGTFGKALEEVEARQDDGFILHLVDFGGFVLPHFEFVDTFDWEDSGQQFGEGETWQTYWGKTVKVVGSNAKLTIQAGDGNGNEYWHILAPGWSFDGINLRSETDGSPTPFPIHLKVAEVRECLFTGSAINDVPQWFEVEAAFVRSCEFQQVHNLIKPEGLHSFEVSNSTFNVEGEVRFVGTVRAFRNVFGGGGSVRTAAPGGDSWWIDNDFSVDGGVTLRGLRAVGNSVESPSEFRCIHVPFVMGNSIVADRAKFSFDGPSSMVGNRVVATGNSGQGMSFGLVHASPAQDSDHVQISDNFLFSNMKYAESGDGGMVMMIFRTNGGRLSVRNNHIESNQIGFMNSHPSVDANRMTHRYETECTGNTIIFRRQDTLDGASDTHAAVVNFAYGPFYSQGNRYVALLRDSPMEQFFHCAFAVEAIPNHNISGLTNQVTSICDVFEVELPEDAIPSGDRRVVLNIRDAGTNRHQHRFVNPTFISDGNEDFTVDGAIHLGERCRFAGVLTGNREITFQNPPVFDYTRASIDLLKAGELEVNNDVNVGGSVNAADAYWRGADEGITGTFSFIDGESQEWDVDVRGGIVTRWEQA